MWQFSLRDDAGVSRVSYVYAGEVLGGAFMCCPQNTATIAHLQADTLADIAEAPEIIMRNQPEVDEFLFH